MDHIAKAEVLVTSPADNLVTCKISTTDGVVCWGRDVERP